MPTYNYKCFDCGHTFERMLKMSDRKIPEDEGCPNCGVFAVKQTITAVANECIDPYRIDGRIKHNEDFREVMGRIKKGNPNNKMKDY